LLRSPELRRRYLAHLQTPDDKSTPDPFDAGADPLDPLLRDERQRLVVDVIAGTSAGGINGIFLAKALANGEAFAPLKNLWIQEGDIAALLNDDQSWTEEIVFAKRAAPPNSLLNSDRMYLKLLHAMQAMRSDKPAVIGQGESALSDEIDLFVTTTDIRGTVVPIRLFDNVVYEKRHKQVYHFNYVGAAGRALANDFRPDNLALLAFSARCTSSFPFAFEPMQVADAVRLAQAGPNPATVKLEDWKPFFGGLASRELAGEAWQRRAFGDGGYLDNKPFSYAVEALSWRLSSVPIERKLIYVEPAPAHPEREAQDSSEKPDAIENAVAALTKIPQYETIREDLEAVLKRNRRIERVERIVRKVESDVDAMPGEPFDRVMIRRGEQGEDRAEVPDWSTLDLGGMIACYGAAFLPYWRLRLTTVSDDLADRMADRWGVDRRSDRMYAMRALVRAWRERAYYEHKAEDSSGQRSSINAFVAVYDIKYRVRRAGFLLRRTHMLLRLAQRWLQPGADWPAESDSERGLRERLEKRVDGFSTMRAQAWHDALLVLRDQLALAQVELRRLAWPPGAGSERSGSE
ncbi:MAG: patatin-like protein, partial [Rubrivivax sp.]